LPVEVQAQPTKSFIPRLAYYLALLYGGQLREGDGFENLCHAYAIAITKFRQFPEHDQMQSVFRFQEATCGMILGQPLMEMHFVELPKYLAGRERRLQTRLEKWLNVLGLGERYAAGEPLPEELAEEEELLMAVNELKRINADAELRQLLELRAKEAHDRATALAEARERGIEEGIQKGIEKGIEKGAREERLVVARRMLSRGLEAPFVAETTGLPLEEVHRLQAGKV